MADSNASIQRQINANQRMIEATQRKISKNPGNPGLQKRLQRQMNRLTAVQGRLAALAARQYYGGK